MNGCEWGGAPYCAAAGADCAEGFAGTTGRGPQLPDTKLGPDKLLFGIDSGPWSEGKGPAPQFALLGDLDLPLDVENNIHHANAEKLFGF